MLELIGKIEFDPVNVTKKHNKQASWKKTAMIKFDCDIWEYYSWFLKKRFNLYCLSKWLGRRRLVLRKQI